MCTQKQINNLLSYRIVIHSDYTDFTIIWFEWVLWIRTRQSTIERKGNKFVEIRKNAFHMKCENSFLFFCLKIGNKKKLVVDIIGIFFACASQWYLFYLCSRFVYVCFMEHRRNIALLYIRQLMLGNGAYFVRALSDVRSNYSTILKVNNYLYFCYFKNYHPTY